MFIRDELYDISFCSVVTNCPFKINNTDIDLKWVLQNNIASHTGSDIFGHQKFHFTPLPNKMLIGDLEMGNTRISSGPVGLLVQKYDTRFCNS